MHTLKINEPQIKHYFEQRDKITKIISKLVPAKEVDDILQDTFIRLARNLQAKPINNIHAFINRIAINLALDYLKKSDTQNLIYVGPTIPNNEYRTLEENFNPDDTILKPEVVYMTYPSADDPLQYAIEDEEIANVTRVIKSLPKKCRAVFLMKKIYGFSQKEIAEKLNISESAVEKHIINGMNRCTDLLSKYKT
jgi:RNA polymerase sigma factor (sigma-70 family)